MEVSLATLLYSLRNLKKFSFHEIFTGKLFLSSIHTLDGVACIFSVFCVHYVRHICLSNVPTHFLLIQLNCTPIDMYSLDVRQFYLMYLIVTYNR